MGFLAAIPALASLGTMMGGAAAAGTGAAAAAGAAGAATTATMVGAGLSAGASIAGGLSSFAASRYQASVAKNNAMILEHQADNTRMAGQTAESQQRMKVGEMVGQQLAAQGANGVDVAIGSTKQVRESTQTMGDFDALTLRYNAARQAWAQDAEAMDQRNTAAQAKRAGTMALLGSFIGAASSVAGGLGKVASMNQTNAMLGVGAGPSISRSVISANQNFIAQPSLGA